MGFAIPLASRAVAATCALALGLAGCGRPAATDQGVGDQVNIEEQGRAQAAQQLAALGAPANAEQRALYEGEFTASGAAESVGAGEGVWELRLAADYAQFERPGLGEDGGVTGQRDYRAQGMRVTAGPLIVTLRAQECRLGERAPLPYIADVLYDGVAYQGCAQRGVSESERPTWAAVLDELLPAIDACLARAESRPARITQASLLGEGQVSVRLREADGGRHGCVAAVDGARVDAFDPLLDTDRLSGEGDPEFLRTPGPAPRASNCRTVSEARSPSGEALGWLIRRTC